MIIYLNKMPCGIQIKVITIAKIIGDNILNNLKF